MLGIGTAASIHSYYVNRELDEKIKSAREKQRAARLKMWSLLK